MGGNKRKLYKEEKLSLPYMGIDELITTLTEWKKIHPEAIDAHIMYYDRHSSIEFVIVYWEFETAEELKKRIALVKEEKKNQDKRDRKEYERLKKIFEKER